MNTIRIPLTVTKPTAKISLSLIGQLFNLKIERVNETVILTLTKEELSVLRTLL